MPDAQNRSTVVITVDGQQAVAELAEIAAALGVPKAQALRKCIAIGAIVYADASARRFTQAADSLADYASRHGGTP